MNPNLRRRREDSIRWTNVIMPLVLLATLVAVLIGTLLVADHDLEAAIRRTLDRQKQVIKAGRATETGFAAMREDLHRLISRHETTTWTLTGALITMVLLAGLVTIRGTRARLTLTQERKHAAEILEAQQSLALSEDKYRTLFSALDEGFALTENAKNSLGTSIMEDEGLLDALLQTLNEAEKALSEAELLYSRNYLYSAANYAFIAKVNAKFV